MKYITGILLTLLFCSCFAPALAQEKIIHAIKISITYILLQNGSVTIEIKTVRKWKDNFCTLILNNNSSKNVRLKEIVMFQINHVFSGNTSF